MLLPGKTTGAETADVVFGKTKAGEEPMDGLAPNVWVIVLAARCVVGAGVWKLNLAALLTAAAVLPTVIL